MCVCLNLVVTNYTNKRSLKKISEPLSSCGGHHNIWMHLQKENSIRTRNFIISNLILLDRTFAISKLSLPKQKRLLRPRAVALPRNRRRPPRGLGSDRMRVILTFPTDFEPVAHPRHSDYDTCLISPLNVWHVCMESVRGPRETLCGVILFSLPRR